jgi:broad specificity phosphatase PhoE
MMLVLARHAQTVENKLGLFNGHTHGTLTKKGLWQAQMLSARLSMVSLSRIYSSDLARSYKTALIIASHHPHIKVTAMKSLRESNMGCLELQKRSNYPIEHFKDWSKHIESDGSIAKRVKKALAKIYDRHKQGAVLIVGHGWLNKVIACVLLHKRICDVPKIKAMHNAAFSVFEIKERTAKALILNSKSHLAGKKIKPLVIKKFLKTKYKCLT